MPRIRIKPAIINLLVLICVTAAPFSTFAQSRVKIKLEGAKSMKNLKINGENIVRYIGNVRFVYSDTRITCDSSYLNSNRNDFDAYGHVVITQGSTKITGDVLHFDGNSSWATVLGKEVVMVEENTRLTTDQLKYNTQQKYAFFNTGGVVKSDDLNLTSRRGYLYNEQNRVIFADNVVMHNNDGDAFTDSLNYNSKIKLLDFYGPSFLFYDSSFIYCEQGRYNIKMKQATASNRAYLINDAQKLFGDKIFYDDSTGYAQVDGNVVVVDTSSNLFVYGQKAQYWKNIGRAKVTVNPYVTIVDKDDTLYLKADTLFVDEYKAESSPDSTYNIIRGVGGVKFYRLDIQGFCDSLRYNSFDSIMVMYGNPVLWQENSQMTAEIIKGFSKNGTIDNVDFSNNAFITMEEAPNTYNQLRGKNINAKFSNGKLYQVDVEGNGQAVYYMRDRGAITMVNRAESANIVIGINDNKISRIKFNKKPKSNLYPIELAQPEDITLKGFKWLGDIRPKDKYSIVPINFVVIPVETGAIRREQLRQTLKQSKGAGQGDQSKDLKGKSSSTQPQTTTADPKLAPPQKKERKGLFGRRKKDRNSPDTE